MDITIALAQPDESKAISTLARETFILACADDSDENDLEKHITSKLSANAFLHLINRNDASVFVAKNNEELAGYMVLIFSEKTPKELPKGKCLQLQKLYIASIYHGTGIAKELVHKMKHVIIDAGFSHAWLTVFNGNQRAIKFYVKMGFKIIGTTEFHVGNDIQKDYLMALDIS